MRITVLGEAIGGEGRVLDEAFLAGTGGRHIDRQEIVSAVDGEAVTREIDKRGVAGRDLAFEFNERAAHGAPPDILRLHHIKAELGHSAATASASFTAFCSCGTFS
jgi:hypothetical protein